MSRRIWSVNAGKIENKKKSLELIQQKTYLKDKGYQLRGVNWLNLTRCILNLKDFHNLKPY
jgi:hypothetical protein